MSKMKNLYTEEQETAAEEMRASYLGPGGVAFLSAEEVRLRFRSGLDVGPSEVASLLAALDEAEATRLEDMRRTTRLLLDVIQAAQYWRERCQS